jgi:hypothetical protein
MDLLNILTPAIALTVLAFLAKFFGKIISDQKPFADERGWDIELNGFNFMLGLVSYGSIGVALALAWRWTSTSWFAHAVVWFLVVFIGGILLFASIKKANERYELKHPNAEKQEKEFLEKHPKIGPDMKAGNEALVKFGARIPVWLVWILIPYFVTQEYFKQNIIWFIVILSQAFLALIFLAIRYSLQKTKLQKVDIHFSGDQEPLIGATLLKVNTDNIRARIEDKVLILNKSKIDKIEMDIYKK